MPRNPTPTALKLVKGERADRINFDEPVPRQRDVTCPSWVSPMARALWGRLAPDLIDAGVLTWWDREAFASMCEWYGTYRKAAADVQKRGTLVKGYRGSQVKNPSLQVARDAWDAFSRAAGKFGLTPADRTQLKVTREPRGADAERFFS
jgi:P27 family predicted phage terminase small subunit